MPTRTYSGAMDLSAPAPSGTVPSPVACPSSSPSGRPGRGRRPFTALLQLPTAELLAQAAARRDALFGQRVTFSPKVFIPLTRACRDRCAYCTFVTPLARLQSPFLELDQVLEIARQGVAAGCREALFTLGERPEERYPAIRRWLAARGHDTTVSYLAEAARRVVEETGLLPHANAGALSAEELGSLRPVAVSQGAMLESLVGTLNCHRGAPDKRPDRRLATLEAAGTLRIPFTTGLLVGIGDREADRLAALIAIAESHRRHGHVQEVIVQNFLPKAATAMQRVPPATVEAHLRTIALARLVLPDDVRVQAPPNLVDDVTTLLAAGVDDLGGISPVTPDHVNPERPWPRLDELAAMVARVGKTLVPRLAIQPPYAVAPETWVDPGLQRLVRRHSDAEGLARSDSWSPGSPTSPPDLLRLSGGIGPASRSGPVAEVLAGLARGEDVGEDEVVRLFSARGEEVRWVAEAADRRRRELVGDEVTFVVNRNINYTNVCTFRCRFCAFSKGPRSLNLRGEPYLLERDEIIRRVEEAAELGATEVCLQGGIHPSFDGSYYLELARAIHRAVPAMHIHGFTALEVYEGARRLGAPLPEYLAALREAGLRTLPGTAAEILDDPVRRILCPDKIDTETWLEVHRQAHLAGLRSNVTIMFGAVEEPRSWARHLLRTRALQRETGGFTEFVPLPFVHMAAPIYLQGRARPGPTWREVLLVHAVGRLVYGADIPNVQASWVKTGPEGVRQLLQAGANDLGGTLIDENISRAAGAEHGQRMTPADFAALVAPLGRPLVQRTTLYGRVSGSPERTVLPVALA
jgi:FO synthase